LQWSSERVFSSTQPSTRPFCLTSPTLWRTGIGGLGCRQKSYGPCSVFSNRSTYVFEPIVRRMRLDDLSGATVQKRTASLRSRDVTWWSVFETLIDASSSTSVTWQIRRRSLWHARALRKPNALWTHSSAEGLLTPILLTTAASTIHSSAARFLGSEGVVRPFGGGRCPADRRDGSARKRARYATDDDS
jgi:hypothetical protein